MTSSNNHNKKKYSFQPLNDICIDCNKDIAPCNERNYIVWDAATLCPLEPGQKRRKRGAYRRQCARCYDIAHERPYERRHSTDSFIKNATDPYAGPTPITSIPTLKD